MNKSIFFLFVFFTNLITAQQHNSFEKYAKLQDSLTTKAYEAKDDKTFEKLLVDFIVAYHQLKANDQKKYSNYMAGMYYNLTCLYALQNNKSQTLVYLKKSIESGFSDYTHIVNDTDLKDMRSDDTFQKLIRPLLELDYTYILKSSGKYNASEKRELPKFTYQSKDDSALVALRKHFNLDSIAGKGDEISQLINLLHWIHNLIPHGGNDPNPVVKNAMSMITECKKNGKTLNCRGLAIVLNECYLAMGFQSRFVTCLPKDSLKKDPDCHVINMVYSRSLKKWLWLDPTNDAYIMNEKNELLGIAEVRERLINNQPLIINPDANWNHSIAVKREYLDVYMTKNLYKLECPVVSEYDLETNRNGKTTVYILLLPVNDRYQQPYIKKNKNRRTGAGWVEYRTNNAEAFWQTPE